jgi:hypothetical protein
MDSYIGTGFNFPHIYFSGNLVCFGLEKELSSGCYRHIYLRTSNYKPMTNPQEPLPGL